MTGLGPSLTVLVSLATLAAVGIHDRGQTASAVSTGDNGSATSLDPGFVQPNLGGGFSGGGFSATPGGAGGSAHTRSHGS